MGVAQATGSAAPSREAGSGGTNRGFPAAKRRVALRDWRAPSTPPPPHAPAPPGRCHPASPGPVCSWPGWSGPAWRSGCRCPASWSSWASGWSSATTAWRAIRFNDVTVRARPWASSRSCSILFDGGLATPSDTVRSVLGPASLRHDLPVGAAAGRRDDAEVRHVDLVVAGRVPARSGATSPDEWPESAGEGCVRPGRRPCSGCGAAGARLARRGGALRGTRVGLTFSSTTVGVDDALVDVGTARAGRT